MIGRTNGKKRLTFGGDQVSDVDSGSTSIAVAE